jgi:hypothetical protein
MYRFFGKGTSFLYERHIVSLKPIFSSNLSHGVRQRFERGCVKGLKPFLCPAARADVRMNGGKSSTFTPTKTD